MCVGAIEPERVRIVEDRRVVVRRAEHGQHRVARLGDDRLAVRAGEHDRLHRHAHGVLNGPVEAQQLVDRGAVERRVVAPPDQFVRVAQQCQRAVADQVDGRLVAGDVQQDDERDQLGRAERVALVLDGEQPRQQVVAEAPTAGRSMIVTR